MIPGGEHQNMAKRTSLGDEPGTHGLVPATVMAPHGVIPHLIRQQPGGRSVDPR